MISKKAKNVAGAKEVLKYLGTAEAQNLYLKSDPSDVAANSKADASGYNALAEEGGRVHRLGEADLAVPRPRRQPDVRVNRDDPGAAEVHQRPRRHRRAGQEHRRPGEVHLHQLTLARDTRSFCAHSPINVGRQGGAVTSSPHSAEVPAPRTTPVRGRRRRRIDRLTSRDMVVVGVILGIAVVLDLALIWATTSASIGLSFTNFNGVTAPKWIALRNYHQIVTIYEPFWRAVRNNLLWLVILGLIATPHRAASSRSCSTRRSGSRGSTRASSTCRWCCRWPWSGSSRSWSTPATTARSTFCSAGPITPPTGSVIRKSTSGRSSSRPCWRHTGYVMILYLAGLKAVDPALKEAAVIDGANERQMFFRVVFPTLRPINIIVLVITVIESLRAFDIVYAINSGRNGLELLSVLVTQNIVGEASRIGFGSAIAVILLTTSLGFVIIYLTQIIREEGR